MAKERKVAFSMPSDVLQTFMTATHASTTADFARAAIKYTLQKKEGSIITPETCKVEADPSSDPKDSVIKFEFVGDATALFDRKSLSEGEVPWVAESVDTYIQAHLPALPREAKQLLFSTGFYSPQGHHN